MELGGTLINRCPLRRQCVLFSRANVHFYRKTEFAECIGKQELSFLNSPAEFGMFVSLRGDLYSFIILRFSSGFNS